MMVIVYNICGIANTTAQQRMIVDKRGHYNIRIEDPNEDSTCITEKRHDWNISTYNTTGNGIEKTLQHIKQGSGPNIL